MPGASVFYKDPTGTVFHTYSAYARGSTSSSAYNWLDLTPRPRRAELPWSMAWVRRHDEYGEESMCCGSHHDSSAA
jgi:predicted dithiol-disulfide oxidoreductase (DUF899 family)